MISSTDTGKREFSAKGNTKVFFGWRMIRPLTEDFFSFQHYYLVYGETNLATRTG
jgi:hypothetical protein